MRYWWRQAAGRISVNYACVVYYYIKAFESDALGDMKAGFWQTGRIYCGQLSSLRPSIWKELVGPLNRSSKMRRVSGDRPPNL